MTPKQQAELDRLRARVRTLDHRNRVLSGAFSKGSLDRFAWLVHEIESACTLPHGRPLIRVSQADARLLRPMLDALVKPQDVSDAVPTSRPRGPFPRGRCGVCGRIVAVRQDGKARFHRGHAMCRLGGQDVVRVP